jgi:hypothetical protein
MLLLFELGEARRIPERTTRAMIAALDAMPIKVFPIHRGDVPEGFDIQRHTSCHCALGSIAQVLTACGVDVARELPWIPAWFPRYQMADGGLNCDWEVYGIKNECPSSMVGTIAAFEAMLELEPQSEFVSKGAQFLVGRELRLGSASKANAEERDRAPDWMKLTFPRFYFYDVLRGLRALTRWIEITDARIPTSSIATVVTELCEAFPDGIARVGRQGFTVARGNPGHFALLDATSRIGDASPALTQSWSETRAGLLRSIDAGRVV